MRSPAPGGNRAAEADAKLKQLYDAVESGIADLADPMLKDRIAALKAIRDQARADTERGEMRLTGSGQASHRKTFASQARRRLRTERGRRDHLCALAQASEWTRKKFASWVRTAYILQVRGIGALAPECQQFPALFGRVCEQLCSRLPPVLHAVVEGLLLDFATIWRGVPSLRRRPLLFCDEVAQQWQLSRCLRWLCRRAARLRAVS